MYLYYMNGKFQELRPAHVKQLLAEEQERLTHLLEELAQSPTIVETQAWKYVTSRSIITTYKAILSPIRRLPSEIICEIFLILTGSRRFGNVVLDFIRKKQRFSHRAYADPLLICHICPSWRRISLGYSTLWTNIHIYFTPRNSIDALNVMTTWLDRINSNPSSIKLYAENEDISLDGVIDALIPRIPTCRRLMIYVLPCLFHQLDVSRLLSGPFLLLEDFTLKLRATPRTEVLLHWDPSSTPFNSVP